MLLLSLSAWAAKMQSLTLPWDALLPEQVLCSFFFQPAAFEEVIAEMDQGTSFTVLRHGFQLASRFLSEHGLPRGLDAEEAKEEEDDEEGPKWTPLCAAVSEHVCKRFLSSEGDCEVMSRAWHLLGDLCRFSRGQAYGPLLSLALPKAGAFLALDTLDAAGASAAVACCQLVCFYLWILKKATWWLGLPSLYNRPFRQATPEFVAAQDMMPALLRLFGISGSAVNSFLRQPAPDGSAIDAQEIPVRLLKRDLMPSLITSSSIEDWRCMGHGGHRTIRQDGLQLLGGAAFARFCLFLEPEEVKTRIAKVLDWARGKQERLLSRPKAEPKDEDASKALE
eukprot:g20599.t1